MHRKTTTFELHRPQILRFAAFVVALVTVTLLGTVAHSYRAAAETARAGHIGKATAEIYQDEAHAVLASYRATSAVADAKALVASVADRVDTAKLRKSVAVLTNLAAAENVDIAAIDEKIERIENLSAEIADALAAKAKAAKALAAANTPSGAQATARTIAANSYGWGESQMSCLISLWTKESNWNYASYNPSSGAGGIPQALPASKMATAGADWKTNASTQIKWGLAYIARGYGTPCAAWSHSQAVNWY